jgi:hypothetical protein
MLVDPATRAAVLGASPFAFSASLDEVEHFLIEAVN